MKIGNKKLGGDHPVMMVAELSANHNQNFESAVDLIHAARDAGADAVKTQTYKPEGITLDSDQDCFKVKGTIWEGKMLIDLYREAYTPWEWQPKLKEETEKAGMAFFSSPFDHEAVEFLDKMSVSAMKIASFELVDIPLIRKTAATGRPLVMSTGMATVEEIELAVETAKQAGNQEIMLLRCVSAYPALPDNMNLRTMVDLRERFGVEVGLSDHTLGNDTAIASVALGAALIEKHLTMSRDVPGPDAAFSLEPAEFAAMVESVRTVEKALGTVCYAKNNEEISTRKFRRSLFVVEDIPAGGLITEQNVKSIRPADGLAPKYYDEVLGCKVRQMIPRGTPLSLDDLERETDA